MLGVSRFARRPSARIGIPCWTAPRDLAGTCALAEAGVVVDGASHGAKSVPRENQVLRSCWRRMHVRDFAEY